MENEVNARSLGMNISKARPTRLHRLVIVPGILGTVYGVSPSGEARYFDYDYDAAYAWAEVAPGSSLRRAVPPRRAAYIRSGAVEANPGPRTRCLWAR